MTRILISNLAREGEKRTFKAHGHAIVGSAGAASFMKGTFEPGWRWSSDVKPIAGTDSCQTRHLGYVISGRMHITADDGTESEVAAGDAFDLPPGHDAFVVGDEPCVMIDVAPEATAYAKGQAKATPVVEDRYLSLVRKGYNAFNAGDIATLTTLFSHDVIQHVPGDSPVAGDYKGVEAVLTYYGKLAALSDGTFRAHLVEVHGDGHGHVNAIHVTTGTRNGVTRVSRGSILFTFLGDKVTDLLELHADLAGDDAFLS
jgi:ketosteroid isomerase-like protein